MQACKIIVFSTSMSYVRPGTNFDLTCSQFGQTEKRRGNNMFQCNIITCDFCMNTGRSHAFKFNVEKKQEL